jgi:hypothetical protein
MPLATSVSELKALIETGVVCLLSVRRCAVTRISSKVVSVAAELDGASSAFVRATLTIDSKIEQTPLNRIRLFELIEIDIVVPPVIGSWRAPNLNAFLRAIRCKRP